MEREYLTVAEAAVLLRFDATAPSDPEEALRKWLRRNAIPVYRRGGRTVLLKRREIEALLTKERG